jgi:hypothetical protein
MLSKARMAQEAEESAFNDETDIEGRSQKPSFCAIIMNSQDDTSSAGATMGLDSVST